MIDRTDNYEERREQTEDMLIDAYCKLDDLTRRLMDRQTTTLMTCSSAAMAYLHV